MKWFIKCIKHYVDFSGRARRKEYWMFTLFNCIFGFVLGIIDGVAEIAGISGIAVLGYLYSGFILLPSIALCVRRLHDVGKSGWFYLIGLIPIVGSIWLLVLFCTAGQPGENKWGPNPKELEA